MELSVSREGRRSYILGNTFAVKSAIKDAGAHWDGDRRAWWIGKHDEAQALVARLTDPEVSAKQRAVQDAERLRHDQEHILGTATKDGKSYYFVGEGSNAKGDWVRLMFRDGSRTFFAERGSVQVTKRYRSEMSLQRLREFAAEKKTEKETGECQCRCHRSAGHFGSGGWALFDGCDRCGCEDDG